jgi:hypothetical protein
METLILVIIAAIAAYTAYDAYNRKMGAGSAAVWGLGTLLICPVIFPIYMAKRPLKDGEVREGGFAWNLLKNNEQRVCTFSRKALVPMRTFTILCLSLLLFAPSLAFSQTEEIDARCAAKWEDNAGMQQHCRQQQNEAKRWVRQFNQTHENSTRMTILNNCKDKWSDNHGHNWRMVKHCTEQQVEAAEKVQDSNDGESSPDIEKRCRQKWEDNFRMQKHCQDQQTDARDWIRTTFDADDSPNKRALLSRCKSKWNDGPGYNWRMVKHCIERQN